MEPPCQDILLFPINSLSNSPLRSACASAFISVQFSVFHLYKGLHCFISSCWIQIVSTQTSYTDIYLQVIGENYMNKLCSMMAVRHLFVQTWVNACTV